MKVLLTGGAGFIGSNIYDVLRKAGYEIVVIDNLSTGKKENLPGDVNLITEDICSPKMASIFKDVRPDVLVHHAAQISVRHSVDNPAFDANINIMGTLNLLKAVEKNDVQRVIFASTGGAIYGEQEEFPATEAHPTNPLSPYGVSKLAVEKYMDCLRINSGISTMALRYSNVYGPRQDAHGEAGVVAIFCAKYLSGCTPVINGDGEQTRDFVYVEDVARANLLALESDVVGEINIATGVEISINELDEKIRNAADACLNAANKLKAPAHGKAARGEQRRSVLSPVLAETRLNWKPEVSINEGIRRTVKYFNERIG